MGRPRLKRKCGQSEQVDRPSPIYGGACTPRRALQTHMWLSGTRVMNVFAPKPNKTGAIQCNVLCPFRVYSFLSCILSSNLVTQKECSSTCTLLLRSCDTLNSQRFWRKSFCVQRIRCLECLPFSWCNAILSPDASFRFIRDLFGLRL